MRSFEEMVAFLANAGFFPQRNGSVLLRIVHSDDVYANEQNARWRDLVAIQAEEDFGLKRPQYWPKPGRFQLHADDASRVHEALAKHLNGLASRAAARRAGQTYPLDEVAFDQPT